ncbi:MULTISPECIES: MoaD/ThiS family protein [Acidiphilium]|uniref:MoaD/ThiS family protein n=1 Tax=Acidiphilium TaxID=522 RepID=UPI000AC4EA2E|nr:MULTISPECIES: MoaD/ThiS family protein [Acidiphilium]
MSLVRVELPSGLAVVARLPREVAVRVEGVVTLGAVLDALEAAHPVLRGTMRDGVSGRRRAFIRFFACQRDFSHCSMAEALPAVVAAGEEALLVVGAIAGG